MTSTKAIEILNALRENERAYMYSKYDVNLAIDLAIIALALSEKEGEENDNI